MWLMEIDSLSTYIYGVKRPLRWKVVMMVSSVFEGGGRVWVLTSSIIDIFFIVVGREDALL